MGEIIMNTPTIRDMAQSAMQAHDYDINDATIELTDKLFILAQEQPEILRQLVRHEARNHCRAQRQKIRPKIIKAASDQLSRGMLDTAISDHLRLTNFPLPDGVTVGNARLNNLMGAIRVYKRQTTVMQERCAWFEIIAQRLGGNESIRVRDVLDEADLLALYDQSRRG